MPLYTCSFGRLMLSDGICNCGQIISRFYNFLENEDDLHLLCDKLAEEKENKITDVEGFAKVRHAGAWAIKQVVAQKAKFAKENMFSVNQTLPVCQGKP